jgi:hypothetical protein
VVIEWDFNWRTSRWFSLAPAAVYALRSLIGAIFPLAGLIVAALVLLPFVTGIYDRALARIDRDAHD